MASRAVMGTCWCCPAAREGGWPPRQEVFEMLLLAVMVGVIVADVMVVLFGGHPCWT